MKKFFNITESYKFEWNDIRAIITILNVVLIILFGLKVSWFGLAIACFGLIKNLTGDRHINSLLMYISNIVLNSYFLNLLYK